MSDKINRKIIQEHAELSSQYAKLSMGLDIAARTYESKTLSAFAINQVSIDDIKEDIASLRFDIDRLVNNAQKKKFK